MIYRVLLGTSTSRQTIYVPAARTGLMLALRAMISQSFGPETPSAAAGLPRRLTEFLRRMTFPVSRRSTKQSEIGAWLQREVARGTIEASKEEVPSFTYAPENTSMSIPLHAASSMITELAPFVILLKQGGPIYQIIFEEPEAHLHLSAQRSMARALARLVNSGVKVLVTSHSDTFVQQLNNLIHLYSHPQKQELLRALHII
jgi:predicted ATPase